MTGPFVLSSHKPHQHQRVPAGSGWNNALCRIFRLILVSKWFFSFSWCSDAFKFQIQKKFRTFETASSRTLSKLNLFYKLFCLVLYKENLKAQKDPTTSFLDSLQFSKYLWQRCIKVILLDKIMMTKQTTAVRGFWSNAKSYFKKIWLVHIAWTKLIRKWLIFKTNYWEECRTFE